MVGKIDGSPVGGPIRRTDSLTGKAAPAGVTEAEDSSRRTNVRATSGSLLARAAQVAGNAPEIDQAKVDRIREAIIQGNYQVDAQATARAFVAMELAGAGE